MPPALVVVHDPQAVGPMGGAEPFSFAPSESEESPYELAQPEGDGQTPSFAIDSRSTATTPTTAGTGKRRGPAPRPQRKKKSPAIEVAKIVLGGIAGLAIAQLLLWWMPFFSKHRQDPFKLGPKVAAFASWIVPAQFHGKGTQPSEGGDEAKAPLPDSPPPATMPGGTDEAGSGFPQQFVDPNEAPADAPSQGAAKSDRSTQSSAKKPEDPNDRLDGLPGPATDDRAEEDSVLSPLADVADDSDAAVGALTDLTLDADLLDMIGSPSSEPEAVDPIVDVAQDTAAPSEPAAAQIVGAPEVTAAELRSVLDETTNITRAWLAAEEPNSRQLVSQSYRALARLGEAITFSAAAGEEERTSISKMLTSLAADGQRIGNIRLLGSRWPEYPQRDTAGVVLVGTVAETRREGELYVTDLVVSDGQDPISVYGTTDTAGLYQKGASILVLGAIVDNPADKVTGYQGDAAWLVWYGLSQTISGN
jgi:hypothetical protein